MGIFFASARVIYLNYITYLLDSVKPGIILTIRVMGQLSLENGGYAQKTNPGKEKISIGNYNQGKAIKPAGDWSRTMKQSKKKAITIEPEKCPKCGSGNINFEGSEADSGIRWYTAWCGDCKVELRELRREVFVAWEADGEYFEATQ